jgi:sugar phosphate isomerase/epimerase
VHPRLSVDQLCFPGAPIDEFVEDCRALGAHHVVLSSPGLLADGGASAAAEALRGDLRVESVNHPFAVHPDLERDEGAGAAELARLIPIAAGLGARSVYVVTGGRGNLDWSAASERFAALIAPVLDVAEQHGVALMVENASGLYADIHIAHTLTDTLAVAETAGIGIVIELQFCWVEGAIDDTFRRAVPSCGLVQVSDQVLGDRSLPGRAVPGDGAIPLERLVGRLLDLGYDGLFDIELLGPRIDAEGHAAAVARAADRMGEILTSLGA